MCTSCVLVNIYSVQVRTLLVIIWDLCRNIANNINFHYKTNSIKINDKCFQYIQKTLFLTYFWPIFPILGAKKFFLENLAVMHNFIWVSSIIPKFRKD